MNQEYYSKFYILLYFFSILNVILLIKGCPKDNFVCKNKKCIELFKLCDDNDDCGDNSDESEHCEGKNFGHILHFGSSNSITVQTTQL